MGESMEQLEMMRTWLAGFPGLEDTAIDSVGAAPGSCGLFPLGYQEETVTQDVLGGCTVRCRLTFLLRRVMVRGEDAAAWLLRLQQWAAQAVPPAFGEECRVVAQKGSMVKASQTGTGTYAVTLTACFTKHYEGE